MKKHLLRSTAPARFDARIDAISLVGCSRLAAQRDKDRHRAFPEVSRIPDRPSKYRRSNSQSDHTFAAVVEIASRSDIRKAV